MAAKKALKKCLQKLSSKEFKEFTDSLLDREGEPRVYKNQIEGKDYMEVTNVMVNVFSEKNVLSVAAEVLRDANLEGLADELGAAAPPPAGVKVVAGPTSASPAPSSGSLSEKEFVDKYRAELAKKLTDTNPLLDLLCSKKVLNDNSYAEIKALPTDNQRMSKLLFGSYVKSAPTCSILFNYLKDEQPFLVEELLES
ncbi:NACHT, LRR and PYD domains-containing protein 1b allele 5 isoform X2 [Oryzias melastigma]|uniref:NACHT, LRR and PYD domains-containing protein 1b allele 5 isoform X2 n=1 Tax=Oryzias melastigma TaxID=30732 RepID=UPI000CF817AE|nr:NACHT, LRR and PYD domains-containing protein 1b allele 5 isoform X2 [Oryzias melastigma]